MGRSKQKVVKNMTLYWTTWNNFRCCWEWIWNWSRLAIVGSGPSQIFSFLFLLPLREKPVWLSTNHAPTYIKAHMCVCARTYRYTCAFVHSTCDVYVHCRMRWGVDLKVCLGVHLPVYIEFDMTIHLCAHVIRERGLVWSDNVSWCPYTKRRRRRRKRRSLIWQWAIWWLNPLGWSAHQVHNRERGRYCTIKSKLFSHSSLTRFSAIKATHAHRTGICVTWGTTGTYYRVQSKSLCGQRSTNSSRER